MTILWTILSIIGLIVTIWYFTSVFNPYGRINYPMLLRKSTGHIFSWILIMIGIISLIMFYRSIQDPILFLKIIGGILIFLLFVKNKLTPMIMPFNDIMGNLYSSGGLNFIGFQTSDFLGVTEPLEEKRHGVRAEIVAEAHYLVFWLHKFPEVAFFFGVVLYKSLLVASLLFTLAFLFEIIRFYLFGASPVLSRVCRTWSWANTPTFIVAAVIFWPKESFLSITLIIFLIIQGWFNLITSVVMLPIRFIVVQIVYGKHGKYWYDTAGVAMNFVINRWRLKLFPADKFNVGQ